MSDERVEECRGIPYSVGYRWNEADKMFVVRILDSNHVQVGTSAFAHDTETLPQVLKHVIQQAYFLASED